MPFSRRQVVRVFAGVAAVMYGKPMLVPTVAAQSQQNGQRTPLLFVLDGMGDEAVVIQYHGQRVAISPQEIIDALKR